MFRHDGGRGVSGEGCGEGMSALADETPRQKSKGERGQGVLGSRMRSGGQGWGAVLVRDEASDAG